MEYTTEQIEAMRKLIEAYNTLFLEAKSQSAVFESEQAMLTNTEAMNQIAQSIGVLAEPMKPFLNQA